MSGTRHPWHFQVDFTYPPNPDPVGTLFMGPLETDEETGVTRVRQDTSNPVTMKLSEVYAPPQGISALADPEKMDKIRTKQRDERITARKKAEDEQRKAAEKAEAEAKAAAKKAK